MPEGGQETDRRWWVLAGSCAGLTVLMLDSTVVNLALPELRRALDASTAQIQWVPNAYLLTIAALVVTAGRLGDILGRRRVFLAGMALFGIGAMVSGIAGTANEVIFGRVVQGVGAALILPLSLTLVNDAFPPEDRGRAMGVWAAVSSIALALGPVIGGVLAGIDWRLIFLVTLPVIVFGFIVVRWAATETKDETATGRIDWIGVFLLSIGLTALTVGLVQAEDWGWDAPPTLGLVAGGLVALVLFWFVEHRVDDPIVDFTLFRNGPYFGASAAAFALVGSYWVVMFFQPQYLQDILGYSAPAAGLLILPITLPMVVMSPFVDRLVKWIGPRVVMGTGMLLGLAGLIVQGRLGADTGYGLLLVGFLLFGVGLGLVYAPMQTAAMAAMPQAKAGIASGVLAMNRILSGALTLAITGSLFHTFLRERIQELVVSPSLTEEQAGEIEGLANGTASAQERVADQSQSTADSILAAVDDAFAYALSNALWFIIGVVAVGATLTWIFVRAPEPEGEREREAAASRAPLHHLRAHFHFHP